MASVETKSPSPAKELPSISTAELSKHNSRDDLWISINGKVYDVTSWLPKHPGGDIPLLSLAGQDVTDAFLAFHPDMAFGYLHRYEIGTLSDYQVTPLASDYRKTLMELKMAGMFKKEFFMYYHTLCLIFSLLSLCVAGVLFSDRTSVHILSAILLGYVWTQCGWIGHDAGHSPIFKNRTLDTLVSLIIGNGITGISISWWKRNHNAHHISCNSLEYDPDLQYIPLFAVSSKFFSSLHSYFYERQMTFDPIARLLVSYQHWTFYPVMAVARINLFAQTFILLFSKKQVRNRALEILSIAVFWIWFIALLSCLPNIFERVAFVLVSFAITGVQHVQFCLNHFSSAVYLDKPESMAFFQAQVSGTLDIACPTWMDWFHGGLQFQVEHHLYPLLPRQNLRKVSGMVQAMCKKHNLPYTAVGFWEANAMIIRTLRTAALQARDLSKPVPKNYLWEAINTHG